MFSVGKVCVLGWGCAGNEVAFVECTFKGAVCFVAVEGYVGCFQAGISGGAGQVDDFWGGGVDGPGVFGVGADVAGGVFSAYDKGVFGVV